MFNNNNIKHIHIILTSIHGYIIHIALFQCMFNGYVVLIIAIPICLTHCIPLSSSVQGNPCPYIIFSTNLIYMVNGNR